MRREKKGPLPVVNASLLVGMARSWCSLTRRRDERASSLGLLAAGGERRLGRAAGVRALAGRNPWRRRVAGEIEIVGILCARSINKSKRRRG